jgi:hypothetical protein
MLFPKFEYHMFYVLYPFVTFLVESVRDKFPKYHMKILLGDFSNKIGREDIFRATVGNESLHKTLPRPKICLQKYDVPTS